MGGVADEAALGLHAVLDMVEHAVEGSAEGAEVVLAGADVDAATEVALAVDGLGGAGDFGDGINGGAGEIQGAERGDDEYDGRAADEEVAGAFSGAVSQLQRLGALQHADEIIPAENRSTEDAQAEAAGDVDGFDGFLMCLDDAHGAVGHGQGLAPQVDGSDDRTTLRIEHLKVDLALAEFVDRQFDEHADFRSNAGEAAADLRNADDFAGATAEGFVDFGIDVGHEEELEPDAEDGNGDRDAGEVEEAELEADAHAPSSRST